MIAPPKNWVRTAFFGCAIVLGLQALWLTAPEISRLRGWGAPRDAAGADFFFRREAAARRAARFGLIRGDLWSELALVYSDFISDWNRTGTEPGAGDILRRARTNAEQALKYSPHNARVWLLLAALDTKLQRTTQPRTAAALKMAYYTGPNESELASLRLAVAVQPGVITDDEVQQLVRQEIQGVLSRKPELKPAILAAYRLATAPAKRLIEDAAAGQDPEFLRSARSEAGTR